MPELPEVETVRRGLQPVMEGARIVKAEARRGDLRRPLPKDFVKRLEGRSVTGLGRRAKYLLADLSSGEVLMMNLGMSGSFRVTHQKGEETPGEFNHPRRFGLMRLVPRTELADHPLMKAIGPEPLGNEFDAAMLAAACRGKKTSLKAALSDQKVVAGLGNIYVCEALHRARLSPKRQASTIATRAGAPTARAEVLVGAIKAVLQDAIKAGGSSLRDHRQTDGELGYFQHHFRVYDREGARCVTPGCNGTVKRIVQSGRSTFYCPTCQK